MTVTFTKELQKENYFLWAPVILGAPSVTIHPVSVQHRLTDVLCSLCLPLKWYISVGATLQCCRLNITSWTIFWTTNVVRPTSKASYTITRVFEAILDTQLAKKLPWLPNTLKTLSTMSALLSSFSCLELIFVSSNFSKHSLVKKFRLQ